MSAPTHSLEISNLTVSYDRVPVLHHISLNLHCGDCVALLGPNGAGKTTFLKAVAGLVPIETGTIRLHGQSPQAIPREISYLPQREQVDWDFPITVRGLVEMGRYAHLGNWKPFSKRDAEIVDQALATLHLTDLAGRQIKALSGGQQQRAFLARSWAQQAHVYLLDEPFEGLDKNAQRDLAEALRQLSREGKLVIVSHHNLGNVAELFSHVILLNGELVVEGSVDAVFKPEWIDKAFATEIFTGPHQPPHSHALDS